MSAQPSERSAPAGFTVAPVFVKAPGRAILTRFWLNHYMSLVDAVYGGYHEFVPHAGSRAVTRFETIDSKVVSTLVAESLGEAVGKDRICVLDLLDLTGLPGTKQQATAAAINAVSVADDPAAPHILVLVDEVPAPEDPLYGITESSNVVLAALDGEVVGRALGHVPAGPQVVAALSNLTSESAETSLRRKLIKVPGFFEFSDEDGAQRHARYWYDGRWCVPEVEELIVRSSIVKAADAIVVCDASQSPWLSRAAAAAAERDGVPPVWGIEEVETEAAHIGRPARIALLAPVCHTGQTISHTWNQLDGMEHVGTVQATAIVSTVGNLDADNERLVMPHGVSVHYSVRVDQRSVTLPEGRFGVPGAVGADDAPGAVQVDRVGHGPLSVYEFHDLLSLCGVREEDHVPPFREPAGDVPDTRKMLEDYGPWLATRLVNLLEGSPRRKPDFILVYPLEPSAGTGPSTSELLAREMRLLFNVTTVGVPRRGWLGLPFESEDPDGDVEEPQEEDFDALCERLGACEDEWARDLRRLSQSTVVLLDEFVSSGGTFEYLGDVVSAAGFSPATVGLAMLDLRPTSSDRVGGVDVRSLYALPNRRGS